MENGTKSLNYTQMQLAESLCCSGSATKRYGDDTNKGNP